MSSEPLQDAAMEAPAAPRHAFDYLVIVDFEATCDEVLLSAVYLFLKICYRARRQPSLGITRKSSNFRGLSLTLTV